jgi:hypothetical protein
MNPNTLSYVIVTIAALIFCGVLLVISPDQSTRTFAIGLVGIVLGHWFGYSNQLNLKAEPALKA